MDYASGDYKVRALLVDDEVNYASAVSARLKRAGFEVEVFNDPQQALAHIASSPAYDIIIVDYHMPALSGNQFLTAVRSLPGLRNARALMQTASDLEKIAEDKPCRRGTTKIISKDRFQKNMVGEIYEVLDDAA